VKSFRISTHITADFLADAEADLIEVMHDRLTAYRDRFIPLKIRRIFFLLIGLLSLSGLLLLALLLILNECRPPSSLHLPGYAFFFLLMLAFAILQGRQGNVQVMPFPRYWRWLARNRAGAMLNRAKKIAPFIAEYDFHGDSATYHRTTGELSRFIWARRFHGFRRTRKNYTLLYKRKKSLYPFAIVLHDPSREFGAYLDELGIASLDEEPCQSKQ
jgi:hypothetical protein